MLLAKLLGEFLHKLTLVSSLFNFSALRMLHTYKLAENEVDVLLLLKL